MPLGAVQVCAHSPHSEVFCRAGGKARGLSPPCGDLYGLPSVKPFVASKRSAPTGFEPVTFGFASGHRRDRVPQSQTRPRAVGRGTARLVFLAALPLAEFPMAVLDPNLPATQVASDLPCAVNCLVLRASNGTSTLVILLHDGPALTRSRNHIPVVVISLPHAAPSYDRVGLPQLSFAARHPGE